jgi:hypothetical protein
MRTKSREKPSTGSGGQLNRPTRGTGATSSQEQTRAIGEAAMTEAEQRMVETKEALSSSSSSEDAPMDDAVLSSGNSGDEDASSTNQSDSPMDGGGGPTGNRAKFKAAQDVRDGFMMEDARG